MAIATEAVKTRETPREKVLVAVSDTESATITVYVIAVALSVAVPVMAPVAEFIDNPDGRLGDIAYVRGAVPPEPTTGINEVAALD